MNKSINYLYTEFLDTLKLCSSKTLELSDSELEDAILEDLDIEYFSTFHNSTLDCLLLNEQISLDIYNKVSDLRVKIGDVIQQNEKRNAYAFRNDSKWLEIYKESDSILQELGG